MRAWMEERGCQLNQNLKRCALFYIMQTEGKPSHCKGMFLNTRCWLLQDAAATDKPRKAESASSKNYRVIKEVMKVIPKVKDFA